MVTIAKLQNPNPKIQTNSKTQNQKSPANKRSHWNLELGTYLGF
jgi:hypothetical protein